MNCKHDWTRVSEHEYHCRNCVETTYRCACGDHPTGTAQLICDHCLTREWQVLVDVANALEHYTPTPPTYVKAASYDIEPVREHREDDPTRLTVSDVPDVLASWADMWAEVLGDEVNVPPAQYLRSRFIWAATNPDASAFHTYRSEVRQLRHVARRAAGLLPKRLPAPCVHCGGTVVRDWATRDWQPLPTGLTDTVRCTSCNITWDNEDRWRHVSATHLRLLPEQHPDTLITMSEARTVWPSIPRQTFYSWARRDMELPPDRQAAPIRSWDERGVPLYRVGDLAALVARRRDDARPGRHARS